MSAESRREQERARRWFAKLSPRQKDELGDAFVLGGFDWREWGFESPPSATFLNRVEYERLLWEQMGGAR